MESHSSMEQQFLKKLTEVLDAHMHNEHFGVSELAEQLGMSRYTLHRRVRSVVKKSVSEFIRDERLKRAYELLQKQTGTVSEVAFKVGFGSVSYFNRCFSERYGFPPGEVLKGLHPSENIQDGSIRTFFKKVKASKILYIIPIIVLLAIVGYHFFQELNNKTIKKTIAVLPPKDIGPVENECVVLEGIREDLQSKLFSLAGLDVVSGTTTDTYRNSEKNLKEIAKELHVNYVVEIRGQTIAENSTIWVQLIETATDKPIWANSYTKELKEEKIQELIREIALVVAKKLDVSISPEEKNRIEKLQTENDAAYRFYNLGVNLLRNFEISKNDRDCYEAKKYFEKAIVLDSAFADAYCQLADIYISYFANYYEDKLYNQYLDSGLVMIENAIKFKNSDQHKVLRLEAEYYNRKGMYNKAIDRFEQLWKNKPRDYKYYYEKIDLYSFGRDYYPIFENILLYLKLKPKNVLADESIYILLIEDLVFMGFPDLAKKYNKELYEICKDSTRYLYHLARIYCYSEEFDKSLEIRQRFYQSDTTKLAFLDWLWFINYYKRDFKESYKYAQLLEKKGGGQNNKVLFASMFLREGREEEAKEYLDESYKDIMEAISFNVPGAQDKSLYGMIAGIYAMRGEKKKALENLRIFASETVENLAIIQLKNFLMWDNIREEPEFKEIMKEIELKYQKGHKELEELFIREGIIQL